MIPPVASDARNVGCFSAHAINKVSVRFARPHQTKVSPADSRAPTLQNLDQRCIETTNEVSYPIIRPPGARRQKTQDAGHRSEAHTPLTHYVQPPKTALLASTRTPTTTQATLSTPPRNLLTLPISSSPFSDSTALVSVSSNVSTSASGRCVHSATSRRYLSSLSLLRARSASTARRVCTDRSRRALIRARRTAALGSLETCSSTVVGLA